MASEPHVKAALEPPSVDLRAISLSAGAALLLLVSAIAGFAAIYRAEVPNRALPPPQVFPEPQVRTDETAWRLRLQSEQRLRLAGYAWVDQSHGFVRIPIERAMQLVVGAGPKAYDPIEPSAAALASPTAGAQRVTSGEDASPPPGNAAEPQP